MATYTAPVVGTNGRPIKITAIASAGTVLYTDPNTAGTVSEVFLKLANTDINDHKVTVQLGGTASPDDKVIVWIPAESIVDVLDGHRINGGVVIRAFADTANVVNAVLDANLIAA